MKKRRPRVLVYASDKAAAEVITRGLAAIDHPRLEIDVTLEPGLACRQLEDRTYDVLLVMGATRLEQAPALAGAVPRELPVVLVGGAPGEARSDGVLRVPMPLSYTLLRQTVFRALGRREEVSEKPGLRRRDQAG